MSTKTSIFDFLNDISQDKKDILSEENESQLSPYMLNRWLSMRTDTLLYAQEMNQNFTLPKRMQYDYYLHSIKKMKRKFSYVKHTDEDDIAVICEYHNCSKRQARQMVKLFSPEDVEYMKAKMYKGGSKNEKAKKR